MSAATRIVTVIVCAGLAACSPTEKPSLPTGGANIAKGPPNGTHKVRKCETDNPGNPGIKVPKCEIAVKVMIDGSNKPQLDLASDDWIVKVKKNQKATITWKLVPPGGGNPADYKFSANAPPGIDFGSGLAGTIDCIPDNTATDKFHCEVDHKANDFLGYKYTINVTGPSGAKPALDPWVLAD